MPERPQLTKTALLRAISVSSLQRLLDISNRLSSTLHLDELLSLVMDVATELTDTQTASILLVDQTTGQLHFAASTQDAVPEDIIVPLDNSIAGWVVRNGRTLILDDVQTDSRFYATVDKDLQFVTESMLAIPLIANDRVIGALEVINKRHKEPFTNQDVALMEALASQSAVAIVNARLFAQSDLLAEIMHELKTPLMAIRSASELLTRPDFPAERQNDLIQMIKRESIRLSNMTKDFLEFARLESGRARLIREPVDLTALVLDVTRIAESQASSRGITIIPQLEKHLPSPNSSRMFIGDDNRLKQVLLNLVSNAIKYNREGGRVTISTQIDDDEVRLVVADTGRGITKEDMEHLFERFYRVPNDEGKTEGSGLGLAITRKIVEQHNGRIEVDSILGQGTTFTVILPLTDAD